MENLIRPRYYLPIIKTARLWILACAIMFTFNGAAGWNFGDIFTIVLGFAFPALYIISGFLVLRDSPNIEKRILRAIKRTAICFVSLLAAYIGLSLIFEPTVTLAAISSREFWMNLLLLNVWTKLPIGSTIWYVQSMLYAYVFIYLIYKLKLLKLDIYIAAVCLAATAVVGELSAVVGITGYIAGSFLTRALPYILIGCFIQRRPDYFVDIRSRQRYIIGAVGLILSFAEYFLLDYFDKKVYFGHLIGTTFVAVAVCLTIFSGKRIRRTSPIVNTLSRFELSIPFYVCSPLYYLFTELIVKIEPLQAYIGCLSGISVLLSSMAVLYIYYFVRPFFMILKYSKTETPDKAD